MTGKERMQRIRRHINGVAWAQIQQFMSGTIPIVWCSTDQRDDLIIAELDQIAGPLCLGLWFWEVEP